MKGPSRQYARRPEATADAAALRAVSVVLTPACNLHCAYCYQDRRSGRRIEWRVLKAAIDLLLGSRERALALEFYGGEPLLAFPLLRRAVVYARARCPPRARLRFGVGTNGLLLDPRRSAFLARYGIRTSLSFDGLPGAQDQRAPGTFARLDATLDHLRQCHPRFFDKHLEVGLTLTAGNLQWLAGSVAYFLAKGVRTVHLNPRLTPDPEWRAVHFDEMDRQLARVYRLSRLVYDHSGRVPLVLFRKQGPRQRTRPRLDRGCGAATGRTLTVDVDGLATGCVLFASSYQATAWPRLQHGRAVLEIGSVTEPGFPRRLERYPQRALESGLLVRPQGAGSSYGQCSECRYRWHCGVCPATIAPSHDGQGGVPDLFCAFTRTALKYRDRFPRQPAKPGIPFVRTAAKLLRQLESGWPSRRRSRVPRSAPRLTP